MSSIWRRCISVGAASYSLTGFAYLTVGQILETAAGTGALTRALAVSLPETVDITARDLNQPVLDLGAAALGLERVRGRQADAQALPFAHQAFDAVLCQFGVMFFPNRHAAFNETRRVMRPGSRLLFTAWDGLESNSLGYIAHRTAFTLFPTLERFHADWKYPWWRK